MQCRQLVIKPCTGESHGQNNRCQNMTQSFVEIRTVLFVNVNLTGPGNAIKVGPDGIEITNHSRRINSRRQSMARPAVSGDTNRRKRKRFNQITLIDGTAPHQGHRRNTLNNSCVHAHLMHFLETDHNVAIK